jgi:dienelactone hydrolase
MEHGSHSPRRIAATVALLVGGCTAVAVGIGLVPHLVKVGVSASSVVAVASLAIGVTALVVAGRRTLGAMRWPARVATVLASVLALIVTVMVVSPAVAATRVPPTEIGAVPADRGLTATDVVVTTDDGVDLAGWWIASANDAAVMLLHGAGSTRSSVLPQAEVLAGAGFGVLLVDSHGHGDSAGRAMDFGWQGDEEVAAGVRYLTAEAGISPERIGLVGMSMGGEQAIGASATTPVAAVVAEGATGRTAEDKQWLGDEYGWRGSLQQAIERAQYGLTDLLTPASPPTPLRRAVADADRSFFLLITAGEIPDEASAANHIATGAPDRVAQWNVAGAGHTDGLEREPEQWTDQVVGFLERHLLQGGR